VLAKVENDKRKIGKNIYVFISNLSENFVSK
jgi:hypothetical protein